MITAIGVPASEQKAIFQKFVRGAATASGGIRGTGLGLAMVRHIVEAHHGTVKVESTEAEAAPSPLSCRRRMERNEAHPCC